MEREVIVGKLDVEKYEGDNFIICEVEEGGKEILAKLNNNITLHARQDSKAKGLNRLIERAYEMSN